MTCDNRRGNKEKLLGGMECSQQAAVYSQEHYLEITSF